MFTGTLIEDLIATVARVEARAEACVDNLQPAEIEPWLASSQESTEYESKLLGVA